MKQPIKSSVQKSLLIDKLRLMIQNLLLLLMLISGSRQLVAQNGQKEIHLGFSVSFFSKTLNENLQLNIYLPTGYDSAKSYNVLYIPDGGIDEDFIHLVGLVRFNTKPWIARFPETIVVGIQSKNRQQNFTFPVDNLDFLTKMGFKKESFPAYGCSGEYIHFLKNELQPYLKNHFKGSGNQTIVGESLAGLLISEILIRQPHLFDTYIIVSPSLWWGNEHLLTMAKQIKMLPDSVKVFIAAPQKKEDKRMYQDARNFFQIFHQLNSKNVFFDYLPDELHSTVFHRAVYDAFQKIYPKTTFSK